MIAGQVSAQNSLYLQYIDSKIEIKLKEYKYLSQVNIPQDLRNLEENSLPEICDEIRHFMIDTVTKIGGHLGAGLGVVELTVALHYVFETPKDKIIFDVGHQGYPHKIITGRKELLHTIRQKGGISGFPKISESEYDAFGCGHASTSISAALGIAVARDLNGEDFKSIAVIGDGSMTGGLAFEALNNAGVQNRNIIVILNDNNISIDENVSAFSHYFNDIFSSHKIQSWKNDIWDIIGKGGSRGDRVRKLVSRLEGSVKSIITPGMLFEALGFNYFGPINGHNIHKLIKILQNIKTISGPVFLHIVTQKGKGYELAERDFRRLHAVGSIDKTTGEALRASDIKAKKYQDVFGEAVQELFARDDKLVAISAAMIEGTGLESVARKYPARVIDVGIAESHAVTFAAGIATQGITPIVAIYSSFLQRAFDNIIHDCALQNLHIVFAIDRAGLVGEDGATHHGVFDIAYLRIIPNMIIAAPKDEQELRNLLYSAVYEYTGCVAIRYPRGNGTGAESGDMLPIPLGKSEIVAESHNGDICMLAIGKMVDIALNVRQILLEEDIDSTVVNARFIKPLDVGMLDSIVLKYKYIFTLEDGQRLGGFGSSVLEYVTEKNYNNSVHIIGIDDRFIEHGTVGDLLQDARLDAVAISSTITSAILSSPQIL